MGVLWIGRIRLGASRRFVSASGALFAAMKALFNEPLICGDAAQIGASNRPAGRYSNTTGAIARNAGRANK